MTWCLFKIIKNLYCVGYQDFDHEYFEFNNGNKYIMELGAFYDLLNYILGDESRRIDENEFKDLYMVWQI